MKRAIAAIAALVVVAAGLTAHIFTRTNKPDQTTASPQYVFAIVPTKQWHFTHRPSPWPPQDQWQLDFGPGRGAVTTFPEGWKFHVGQTLDLGVDGSWRLKAIEGRPGNEVLPRLVLARIKTWK